MRVGHSTAKYQNRPMTACKRLIESEKMFNNDSDYDMKEINAFISKDKRGIMEATSKRLGQKSASQYALSLRRSPANI